MRSQRPGDGRCAMSAASRGLKRITAPPRVDGRDRHGGRPEPGRSRDPGFTAIAIVSLAVGIGANTAIFSIFNSLVLRPRPIADPDRIVELFTGERGQWVEGTSYPSYVDFRDRSGIFTGLAAYGIRQYRLGDAINVEQIWGELVSANYFDVLGVPLARGRGFRARENVGPGRNPVVVAARPGGHRR